RRARVVYESERQDEQCRCPFLSHRRKLATLPLTDGGNTDGSRWISSGFVQDEEVPGCVYETQPRQTTIGACCHEDHRSRLRGGTPHQGELNSLDRLVNPVVGLSGRYGRRIERRPQHAVAPERLDVASPIPFWPRVP